MKLQPLVLNEKEWNSFQEALKNPPKANRALKKLLKRIEKCKRGRFRSKDKSHESYCNNQLL